MSEPVLPHDKVAGERDGQALARAVSVQSRLSNVLAIGLMSVLGLGMLGWYYAQVFTRQAQTRSAANAQTQKLAAADLPLPGIGRVDPPLRDGPPANSAPPDLPEAPLAPASALPAAAFAGPPAKSPMQLALERQLSGSVFASPPVAALAVSGAAGPPESAPPGDLAPLLRSATVTPVRAEMLPTQRLLLPKGAFLDCTLETAIDSSLPGMTTCVLATDTFGVDGAVILLERGTKLVGETRGQVQQGASRVFVLWNEARTPAGVIVPLASPGADELGRSGLPGSVERHFWQRFGAAMLVSVIDGAVQTVVQSSRRSGGAVVVNPSATQDVMTEVLKNTIAIPPTVIKTQGDRIQVLVARDLDFRSVYELDAAAR